jgi:hypothetical protein
LLKIALVGVSLVSIQDYYIMKPDFARGAATMGGFDIFSLFSIGVEG